MRGTNTSFGTRFMGIGLAFLLALAAPLPAQANSAQAQSIFMVKPGGLVVFFGGVPKGSLTELDTNYIHYNNIWIKGHFGASYIQSKRAFELAIAKTGEAIKVVLFPNGMEQ